MRLLLRFAALVPLIAAGCAAKLPVPLSPPEITPASLRAHGVVEMKRVFTISGRALILARSPASFRIEVFGPFGQTAALLASDGETIYTVTEEGTESFSRHEPGVPYSLKPEDITSFLLGNPRPANALSENEAETARDEHGRLRLFSRPTNGQGGLKVLLEDYREVSGAHIPFRIIIDDGKRTITIKYNEVEVNPALPEDLFRVGGEAGGDDGGRQRS